MNNDTELQDIVANVSHHAISQSASTVEYSVYPGSFHIYFYNVSGALFIRQSLCASTQPILSTLGIVISVESQVINAEIERELIDIFLNGNASTHMTVAMYLNQLCPHLLT